MRIAQMVIAPIIQVELDVVGSLMKPVGEQVALGPQVPELQQTSPNTSMSKLT